MSEGPAYGWCFSHGRLHERPAWCGAYWVRLKGDTAESALADKSERFGAAEFMEELPTDDQLAVMRIRRDR